LTTVKAAQAAKLLEQYSDPPPVRLKPAAKPAPTVAKTEAPPVRCIRFITFFFVVTEG